MRAVVTAGLSPSPLSVALVLNVADWKGLALVRSLAEAGVGVAIHFTAHRQAVASLVEDIWDRGGRVCALDGVDADEADREALLGAARSILGDVHMVVDASSKAVARDGRPATGRRDRCIREAVPASPPRRVKAWRDGGRAGA